MDQLFPIFGLVLIVAALLQFGLWTGRGLRLRRLENKRFEAELSNLRSAIYSITNESSTAQLNATSQGSSVAQESTSTRVLAAGDWNGFRKFAVARLVKETDLCTSVFLIPSDGLPIVGYQPGQHLTLRFPVPGQAKPPIRCYTLSDAPNDAYYRISVKRNLPPAREPNAAAGLVSNFVNDNLQKGDTIDIKSPNGSFFMKPGNDAIVLLAGGIGITPMLSMINSIAQSNNGRECLLVYGVRNSSEHAFRKHLSALASKVPNIHVINCYSDPLPKDQFNVDYHVKGFVSIDILRQVLPNNKYDFYLCGPPPFMQSIYDGLNQWGVADGQIRYESFGPATIRKTNAVVQPDHSPSTTAVEVRFAQSSRKETWTGKHENLLGFMEELEIPIDSGCRAGSCGTCQVRLLKGQVLYEDVDQIECEPGHCLPCVAIPAEAIEIDA